MTHGGHADVGAVSRLNLTSAAAAVGKLIAARAAEKGLQIVIDAPPDAGHLVGGAAAVSGGGGVAEGSGTGGNGGAGGRGAVWIFTY